MPGGYSTGFHCLRILRSLDIGGNDSKEATCAMPQTGGDSLEVEILGPMAKGGGKHINFFHRSMIHRRYINHITKLEES